MPVTRPIPGAVRGRPPLPESERRVHVRISLLPSTLDDLARVLDAARAEAQTRRATRKGSSKAGRAATLAAAGAQRTDAHSESDAKHSTPRTRARKTDRRA